MHFDLILASIRKRNVWLALFASSLATAGTAPETLHPAHPAYSGHTARPASNGDDAAHEAHRAPASATPQAAEAHPSPTAHATPPKKTAARKPVSKKTVKKSSNKASAPTPSKETHAKVSTPAPAASHSHAEGMTPSLALQSLREGNERFVSGRARHVHQEPAHRQKLAQGQHPHSIIVSCSDSRVPPELVFDQGLGDLFVIRVAGQALDAYGLGSIEYAIDHLGSRLIVVMGHDSCGAVKATLATAPGTSAGSPAIDQLVTHMRPNLKPFTEIPKDDARLIGPVKANVNSVGQELVETSEVIARHVNAGKVQIATGIYHLDSGQVEFWDFEPIVPKLITQKPVAPAADPHAPPPTAPQATLPAAHSDTHPAAPQAPAREPAQADHHSEAAH